jgi:hypothetical protein
MGTVDVPIPRPQTVSDNYRRGPGNLAGAEHADFHFAVLLTFGLGLA